MRASTGATTREPVLQNFINLVRESLEARLPSEPGAAGFMEVIFGRLEERRGPRGGAAPSRLAVCGQLDAAFAEAERHSTTAAKAVRAFMDLEPSLNWARRPPSDQDPPGFQDHHANALVVGPGGLEQREDVWIGVSLMAPHTRYPDHAHPPEEVYLALSGGEWRQNQDPWRAPGFGGLVHNPPHVVHSMRSLASPLLAIWLLRLH